MYYVLGRYCLQKYVTDTKEMAINLEMFVSYQ